MTLNSQEITQQLNKLLTFVEPVHSLMTSHLNSFFTKNFWDQCVPSNIKSELNNLSSVISFIQIYPEIIKDKCPNEFAEVHPNLINFVRKAVSVSIIRDEKYVKLLIHLKNLIKSKGCSKNWDEKMEKFMPEKKSHEVKETSAVTAFLSELTQNNYIVDVGGGKGYLSCSLALDYSFKVLGLDFLEVNTCGAAKRSENVARYWNGKISSQSKNALLPTKRDREQYIQNHFKQVTAFVEPHTNVENFLSESFNEEIKGITLTGLHTCGDLASTSLRMFVRNEKIKGIVNIGCCYNKINEEFSSENSSKLSEVYGFPMSSFLKKKKYALGRNARMLACHSLDRMTSNISSLEFEQSQNALFYRAIIETFKKRVSDSTSEQNLKRLAKKCDSYHEFMLRGLKKFGISDQYTEKDLDRAYEFYADKKPLLTAFYLLRVSLAPVVESIILLDRILYLIESGIHNVYLVPLFNLEISPRGFGVIAWKDFDKT